MRRIASRRYFRPNPVAAMPSIHAAFPVLVWLVLWKRWHRWGWMLVVYPLAMGFAVVYLGQHYVIDVLAGWVYAVAALYLIWGGRSIVRFQQVRTKRGGRPPALATETLTFARRGTRAER
ncbi:MAG TPA: phosphatase PAP2 family protein [Dehalococcoidia bacterium]|nr:phosphatase PAP2 family protein [Dehalococcoidia bacterium]